MGVTYDSLANQNHVWHVKESISLPSQHFILTLTLNQIGLLDLTRPLSRFLVLPWKKSRTQRSLATISQ